MADGRDTIVIYRLGSLGDTVVALPCFHAIRKRYPKHKIIVLTNKPVSEKAPHLEDVLGDSGLIDGSISYPVGIRGLKAILSIRRSVMNLGAGTLIHLGSDRGGVRAIRDGLFFFLCGFRRIIGLPMFGRTIAEHGPSDLEMPEAERLVHKISKLGPIDLQDRRNWDLGLTKAEHNAALEHVYAMNGLPFIAVNTGGKDPRKDWGLEKWSCLLDGLSKVLPNRGLVFVGADSDDDRAIKLAKNWSGPVISTCGSLRPRETAALLENAELFIGHDSGPLHLAAAVGARTVSFFGAWNRPRRWHPYGRDHIVFHDMRGLEPIKPATVLAAVELAFSNSACEFAEGGASSPPGGR